MIVQRETRTPERAASDFYYFSKLLAGKLIVNIVVYADESGTHDLTSKQNGSHVAVLGGYAGMADDWVNFSGRWQTILNEYKVDRFHFSEYADKINKSEDRKWPYYGWCKEKRTEFLFALAKIAGSRDRFPFASSFHLSDYHSDAIIKPKLREIGLTDEQINGPHLAYLGLFADFFEAFFQELEVHHPQFNDSVSFVFDQQDTNVYWRIAAGEMFEHYKTKTQLRLVAPTFGNTWDHVPLQAADLVAYRFHQIWENEYKTKTPQAFRPLDYALWGNFRGEEDLKNHFRKLLGRELRELKNENSIDTRNTI